MKILKNAVAGTLESSDLYIQIEPDDKELQLKPPFMQGKAEKQMRLPT